MNLMEMSVNQRRKFMRTLKAIYESDAKSCILVNIYENMIDRNRRKIELRQINEIRWNIEMESEKKQKLTQINK